jgi:hypothetical protein
MADEEGTEQGAATEPNGFHVELSENTDARVFVDSDEEADDTEATESAADEQSAAPAADEATEEKPVPPTAEELGYDLKNPKDKAAFDAMLKKWTVWATRHDAKQKQQAKPAEPAPPPPPATEATGDAWDPYTVPLDKFVYDGGKETEDSVLAGAESDIDRRIQKGVAEGIKFALDAMRQNDARLRQQAAVGTAQERIAAYAEALQAHPEWEDKAPLVAKIAAGTKDLAIQDPDEWIAMVEARTGITRNWRDEAQAEQSAATSQRAQQNQRLATKPRASVARPTNGSATLASQPRGDLGFNQAFDAAWQKARH